MLLRDCDFIFGCLDGYSDREQVERLARRFAIPYVDSGMDVHAIDDHYLVTGQVSLSIPDAPCMWCMGLLTECLLTAEVQHYGRAGHRPQVILPNAILASTAIGVFMQTITPWSGGTGSPVLLEYDGNSHTVSISNKLAVIAGRTCPHFAPTERGDPFFVKSLERT